MRALDILMRDPRHGQILALSCLIGAGVLALSWEMPLWRPVTAISAALAVQALASWIVKVPFDWRSPLITAGSLTLLLRTDGPALLLLAASLAIASKFLFRVRGRHIWNPAALAIVAVTAAAPGAWVSPGQWGTEAWVILAAAGLGTLVTGRARRAEVPLLFLAAWAGLSVGRALWLGDPIAVPLHQLQSGALIVFAFFMISDPMTQPWHPGARAAWIGLVAALGFALQHAWIVDAGPLWGLVLAAPLVPLFDRLLPHPSAAWRPTAPRPSTGVPA